MNRILQIYHKPEQLPGLVFEPYLNPPTAKEEYLFMESRVIAEAFHVRGLHKGYRYSGVLSPGYREKLDGLHSKRDKLGGFMRTHADPSPENLNAFLDRSSADVVSLVKTKKHDLILVAERFHPYFGRTLRTLLTVMGIGMHDFECEDSVYFNYFLASEEFMTHFSFFIADAIKVMIEHPELRALAWMDSKYNKQFPLTHLFGIDYWPLHPFIAERLISCYIKLTNPKVEYFL